MERKTILTIFVVFIASLATAQQAPQTSTLPNAAPPGRTAQINCDQPRRIPVLKNSHVPAWLQRQIDKHRKDIEDRTGIHVPTPEEIATEAAKACAEQAAKAKGQPVK